MCLTTFDTHISQWLSLCFVFLFLPFCSHICVSRNFHSTYWSYVILTSHSLPKIMLVRLFSSNKQCMLCYSRILLAYNCWQYTFWILSIPLSICSFLTGIREHIDAHSINFRATIIKRHIVEQDTEDYAHTANHDLSETVVSNAPFLSTSDDIEEYFDANMDQFSESSEVGRTMTQNIRCSRISWKFYLFKQDWCDFLDFNFRKFRTLDNLFSILRSISESCHFRSLTGWDVMQYF